MAPRALWKGRITLAAFSCPVSLHAAASTAGRVALTLVDARRGHPLRREYVDEDTEEPVAREDQVKGYETEPGRFVTLTQEEIDAAAPAGDKTLAVADFVPCDAVDTTYFDKPYFLAPDATQDGPDGVEAYRLLRDGLREASVAAVARAVLFRRVRTLLIRPNGDGLVANTLNFDYEVRPARAAFRGVPEVDVADEMLDLAEHIVAARAGVFDPAGFDDRYDAALADLVAAKAAGKAPPRRPAPPPAPKGGLLEALRESAALAAPGRAPKRRPASPRRKPAASGTRRKAG